MPTATASAAPAPPRTGQSGTAVEDIGALAVVLLLGVAGVGALGARVLTAARRR